MCYEPHNITEHDTQTWEQYLKLLPDMKNIIKQFQLNDTGSEILDDADAKDRNNGVLERI